MVNFMKILSFGEIIWDIYENERFIGGAPLNFAAHTVRRGAETYMLSAIGCDALGKMAKEQLRGMGIRTDYLSETEKPTGRCLVTLDNDGVPKYEVIQGVAYEAIPLPTTLKEQEFSVLAFGSLALRTADNREIVEKIINEKICKTTYCDLNLRAPFYTCETVRFCLERANILKLSEDEFFYVKNSLQIKEEQIQAVCRAIVAALPNLEILVVTFGEKGSCAYAKKNQQFVTMESESVNVVSTVGAGDSFGAAFLTEYLQGKDLQACLRAGTKLSAYVVAHKAAVPD